MKINYARSWFRARKKITKEWSVEEARNAHNNREMYTAILGGLNAPYCFVEIRDDFISVGFLDDNIREYLVYNFTEYEPGKLFLTHAYYRIYDGETDNITYVDSYVFFRDGRVSLGKRDIINQTKEEAESTMDVSGNYLDYPDFGDYRIITRKER